MKIYVLNGPNLNMLGMREPEHYGKKTYAELVSIVEKYCSERGVDVEFFQSNHEGALVDRIQEAYFKGIDGIVINPGAYTHTSIALLDAIKAVMIPTVEVHISDLSMREDFRQVSYIRPACIKTITGHGIGGYTEAVDAIIAYRAEEKK